MSSFLARSRVLLFLLAIGVLVVAPQRGLDAAASEVRRTVDADPRGVVSIESFAGRVVVEGGDAARVEVDAVLARPGDELRLERQGARVRIEVESAARKGPATAELRVVVPRGSRLEIGSLSAEVEIRGLTGTVEVETVSGTLRLRGRPSEVRVETVSGTVDIADGAGRVRVESVSGPIEIAGAAPRVEARSVSGPVALRSSVPIEHVELGTVTGRLELDAASVGARARIDLESHSGSVRLAWPADASARVEVETFSGLVESAWPSAETSGGRIGPGSNQTFQIGEGAGAAAISIETFSGTIAIARR